MGLIGGGGMATYNAYMAVEKQRRIISEFAEGIKATLQAREAEWYISTDSEDGDGNRSESTWIDYEALGRVIDEFRAKSLL